MGTGTPSSAATAGTQEGFRATAPLAPSPSPIPATVSAAILGIDWWGSSLPSGFVPRVGAGIANDPVDGLTLVFGGCSSGVAVCPAASVLGDTWVLWYANQTLHRVSPAPAPAPPARSDAALVFDRAAGVFVLFGGEAGPISYLNDVWWFYPTNLSWRQPYVVSPLPPGRCGMAYGVDPSGVSARVVVFGGVAVAALNDTWAYSPLTLSWTSIRTAVHPGPLWFSASASSTTGLSLFGGSNFGNLPWGQQTWNLSWPSGAWANWTNDTLASTPPAGRELASMVALPSMGEAVLFGGLNGTSTYLDDVWVLNLTNFHWTLLPAFPLAAQAHGPLTLVGGPPGALWVLGGVGAGGAPLSTDEFGGALPAPAPSILSGGPFGPIRAGAVWHAWGNASASGGFGVAAVNLRYQVPGGGSPVTASLIFSRGVNSSGTLLSGNWTGTLPPVAGVGALTWTLTVVSTGGSSTSISGSALVVPANATLSGFVYEVPLGPSGASRPSPLSGARVIVEGLGSPQNWTNTTTLPDGSFSITLPAGTYEVTANRSGYLNETNASFAMGWAPASMIFFLPNPSGRVANFNGTVGICGYADRLVDVQVFADSVPPRYNVSNSTNSAGTFNMTLVPGLTYNVTFALPGFARAYAAVTINATGSWVHGYCLRALNPNLIVTVTMSAIPSQPPPGSMVTVNLSIRHETSSGVFAGVSSGTVALGLSWAPSNYLAITLGAGTAFRGGWSNIAFTLPASVRTHTNCTINATIASPGLPTVSESVVIYVLKNYTGTGVTPSNPSTPLWETVLPYVGIAVVVAILVAYVLRGSNASRVEEIFLVYKGGKLVWHASRTARADLEPEVVTGMLQAVEGFLQKSFSPEGGHLNVLEFANMKLHIVRGHRLVAAVVLSGRNPKQVLREVAVALEDMEKAWHEALIEWDGTTTSLPHLRARVDALLAGHYRHRTHLKASEVDVSKIVE